MELTKREVLAGAGAAAAAVATSGAALAASKPGPVVMTEAGMVRGEQLDGVLRFRGIPYAGSVAGRGRWLAPPLPKPWKGIREANAFGPIIPQPFRGVPGGDVQGQPAMNEEDALSINIWTQGADDHKRPVMVWISCGAFMSSNGGDAVTDGENQARQQDTVMVTFNCRPGLLGFLYLGDVLGGEYQAGNAGLLDQIAALRWVRDNIAIFGGDPGNVTIFGCSGSGFSAAALMAMPRAKGLFHRAIIESGADFTGNTRRDSSEYTRVVLCKLGIENNPEALFDVPAETLLRVKDEVVDTSFADGHASTRGGPVPCIDKVTLPAPIIDCWTSGSADGVDLLIGCNQEEMNLQLPPGMATSAIGGLLPREAESLEEIAAGLAASCDGLNVKGPDGKLRALTLVEGYHALQPDRPLSQLNNFLRSEMLFRIQATRMAAAQMSGSGRPVYVYLFNWGPAYHGLEIGFVFNNLTRNPLGAPMATAPGAQPLADKMSKMWAQFARTGIPDAGWPAYSIARRETMVFSNDSKVESDPLGKQRALWNGVPLGNRTLLASQIPGRSVAVRTAVTAAG
jgi:para-nitrobenzyl esterase